MTDLAETLRLAEQIKADLVADPDRDPDDLVVAGEVAALLPEEHKEPYWHHMIGRWLASEGADIDTADVLRDRLGAPGGVS